MVLLSIVPAHKPRFDLPKLHLKLAIQYIAFFFYGDSVFSSSQLNAPQRDEWNTYQAWADLADQDQLDLVVCIAAALKRGVLDEKEAKRHEKAHFNVAPPFQLSGLGQLTDAMMSSDRIISFGE